MNGRPFCTLMGRGKGGQELCAGRNLHSGGSESASIWNQLPVISSRLPCGLLGWKRGRMILCPASFRAHRLCRRALSLSTKPLAVP